MDIETHTPERDGADAGISPRLWWGLVIGFVLADILFVALAAWWVYALMFPATETHFENMPWHSLDVAYEVVMPEGANLERELFLQADELADLKACFKTLTMKPGEFVGAGGMTLTLENGQEWYFGFTQADVKPFFDEKSTPDLNYLRKLKGDEAYESFRPSCLEFYLQEMEYHVTLDGDNTFYTRLRELCLEHEQQQTPGVKLENIKLLTVAGAGEYTLPLESAGENAVNGDLQGEPK